MTVVILCGGLGTRLREETEYRPKPMVPIGEKPILWHIMKNFSHQGHNEFVLALGYKGDTIKSYFHQYYALARDVTIDLATGHISARGEPTENWKVHLIDTGLETNTAGRVLRLREHLKNEPFLLTYGDGVCDVDLASLISFHKKAGKMVTLTAVHAVPRFGNLQLDGDAVSSFEEKMRGREGWVNGGYMVVEPEFFSYIRDDSTGLEVLAEVAADGQLAAYRHEGYWQCMDTMRDKELLEKEWNSDNPPWKVWE